MGPSTPLPTSRQSYQPSSSSPLRSSPLNPNYANLNPPSQRRASMKSQFHTQSRYIRVAPSSAAPIDLFGASTSEQDPQRAVWRERFRRKCAERSERDRVKYRNEKRSNQLGHSDSPELDDELFISDGDEEYDQVDDELYSAFMISERRRQSYAHKVSFARAVGSSIDPDMDGFEDLERHFAGPVYHEELEAPTRDYPSDDIDFQIPSDMELYVDNDSQMSEMPEAPDFDMDFNFSSPPASPSTQSEPTIRHNDASFVGLLLGSPCPHCHAPFSLHADSQAGQVCLECAICTNSFFLGDAVASWDVIHSPPSPSHTPLPFVEPALSDGVLLMCSNGACDWGVSL